MLLFHIGAAVDHVKLGDRVLINTTTQCGKCANCKRQFFGHCDDGGWKLGKEFMMELYVIINFLEYESLYAANAHRTAV